MIAIFLAAETAKGVESVFPPFDPWHFPSQIFWLTVLFGALYFVLSRFVLPKLGGVLEKRQNTIADNLDEAARLNDQAIDAQKAVESSIAEARAEARDTAAKARSKIDSELRAETAKADAELDKKLEAAEAQIAARRAEILNNVEAIATDAAEALIEKFDGSASTSDVKKAVGSALAGGSK
ncbi:MAG: hypothetical protein AAGJ84_06715 [Pseudomonadota bacterium]